MFTKHSKFLFSFHSPYNPPETVYALVSTIQGHTAQEDRAGNPIYMDYLSVPPLSADVYFSTVRDDLVVITAGNRVQQFWNVTFELTPHPKGGVIGEVNLDRPRRDITQWMGNVFEIQMVAGSLYRQCSFQITAEKL